MSRSPSLVMWRRVVKQAHEGDLRHLLELLLVPHTITGHGEPAPSGFYALPDDAETRLAIVRALLFRTFKSASTVQELMTKTARPGAPKPSISEYEVAAAELLTLAGAAPPKIDALAESLGVDGDTLRGRIKKRRKRKDLPPG